VIETLVVLTVVVLGVAAGALLAEAVILVPFWQSIEAPAFLRFPLHSNRTPAPSVPRHPRYRVEMVPNRRSAYSAAAFTQFGVIQSSHASRRSR
jgi:hypothetical protein